MYTFYRDNEKVLLLFQTESRTFAYIDDNFIHATSVLNSIVKKMKNIWTLRNTIKIEGYEYSTNYCSQTIILRISNILVGNNINGILLQSYILNENSTLKTPINLKENIALVVSFLNSIFGDIFSVKEKEYSYENAGIESNTFEEQHLVFQILRTLIDARIL
ncbi:hypothetical protein HK099_007539 [Clydaea vesicula]|uniref:Mediator of RNA polymerase II transcription subunit 20 n=1 Tax=Clydaea vesicula TaxID=447962 RepID=A0AAD5U6M7_9FUNG|nr:hypothetical protein HK099_007539 [Clydaea vesicula]